MRKNIFKGLTKQKAISTLEKLINSKENLNYCYQIVEGLWNGDFDGNADPQIYLYWLTKLAENDSHLAMNKLGQIYSNGQIVPIDIDKAKYWYTKALQSNDYVVKQNFAHMLMTISDDPDDNKQGFELCVESVNEGGNDGAYILGIAYDDGLGVEKDRNSACLLYQIAVATSKWCREDAEKELTSYKVDHVKPVTYLDFYPNLKYNGNVFGPEDMQRAVFNGIDFNLSFDQWHLIEYAFKDYLDKHQNDFFEIEDLCKNVVNRSQHCSTGLSIDQMNNILDIMIDFAVCTGGIIDEDKEYVYWNNETDMLDYKLFSPLTALYSSDDQSSFISIISQIIKDKKNSSVVWSRSKGSNDLARNISKFIFGDQDYQKYFTLEETNVEGIRKLHCIKDSMEFANLYIIDNKSLNVFDFCGLVHLCKRDCNIGAVFVDDIDLLSLSTELSSLKPSKILQWSTILFKALARSLNIPVLIQEFVADIHAPSQIQPPTSDNAVSHRELIEDIPDRIVVVCYEEDKDTPNYTVLKDNKYSTGKVIFETPCPF